MHYIDVPIYWPYEKDITYKGRFKLEHCKPINETLSDLNHYLTFCEEIVKNTEIQEFSGSRAGFKNLLSGVWCWSQADSQASQGTVSLIG